MKVLRNAPSCWLWYGNHPPSVDQKTGEALSGWSQLVDSCKATIEIGEDAPGWQEAFKRWTSGKNPSDDPAWKSGVFLCFIDKNEALPTFEDEWKNQRSMKVPAVMAQVIPEVRLTRDEAIAKFLKECESPAPKLLGVSSLSYPGKPKEMLILELEIGDGGKLKQFRSFLFVDKERK